MKSNQKYRKSFSLWRGIDVLSWIVLLGTCFFTDFHYHLIIPSGYLVVRAFIRNSRNKTDLKNAVDYCRIKKPVKDQVILLLISAAVGIVLFYGFKLLEPYLPKFNRMAYAYFLFTLFVPSVFIARLSNFTSGIRWYISGIKLPGENSLLIPWRHVSEVQAKGGNVHLKVFNEHYSFRINSADYRSAIHFQRWFEKKKAALND